MLLTKIENYVSVGWLQCFYMLIGQLFSYKISLKPKIHFVP